MRVVHEGVDGVGDEEGYGDPVEVPEGDLVVLLGLFLGFTERVSGSSSMAHGDSSLFGMGWG